MRRYERQFLAFWVGQVRGFRLEKHLTQEELAEALYLSARSYQKLEQGVHQPCATTLALFLGQLSEEVLAFVRTFAQLVETARFQEAPDAHEITAKLPGESRRARAPGGP